jgi:hypothetical protein
MWWKIKESLENNIIAAIDAKWQGGVSSPIRVMGMVYLGFHR